MMFPISCLVYSINHRVCLLTTIRLENITHNVCYVLRLHPWNQIVIDHKFLATNAIFGYPTMQKAATLIFLSASNLTKNP